MFLKIKLQEILDNQSKTIYSLSKETGVAQNNLSKLVRGETTSIKYDILEKLCIALKITPNEIFEIDYPFPKNIITGDDALQSAKQFEEYYGYNPIMSDDELYTMEQQQIRLDMEYDFESTLESIINSIISKTNIDLLPNKIQAEIKAYKEVGDIGIAFKLTLIYRAIYWVMAKQLYNKILMQFMSKVRKIYTNNTNLSALTDGELAILTNESITILESLNKKE